MDNFATVLEVGKRYKVFFNGEECMCTSVCVEITDEGYELKDDSEDGLSWSTPIDFDSRKAFHPTFLETTKIIRGGVE